MPVPRRSFVVTAAAMASVTGTARMRLSLAKVTTRERARALASASPGRTPITTCMLGQMYMCTNIHMASPPSTPAHSSAVRAGGVATSVA